MRRNQLTADHKKILAEIVLKHKPVLLSLLDLLGHRPLTVEQKEELREIIAKELCETGLDESDQPNQRGLSLEELIDSLGHI